MKIGYLVPEFPGQTHNFFFRELKALHEQGVETCLISTRRPKPGLRSTSWGAQAEKDTIYIYPLTIGDASATILQLFRAGLRKWISVWCVICSGSPTLRGRLRLAAISAMSLKLAGALGRAGVRHVHVHSCADAANLALFAHIFADVSYSLTLHNPVEVYGGNQRSKWVCAKFGIIITKLIRDDLLKSIPELDLRKLVIAPMGVEVDLFNRVADYKAFEVGTTLKLFCCARLNAAKGYSTLLAATQLLIKRGILVSLRIAGEDDEGGTGYRRVVEALIQQLELSGHVVLLGAVAEEQVIAELERAHIFVLASDAEPLGVVLMEAMAMQVPVVATSAGGVSELVDEGVDGLLIPPRDAEALASSISELANDPALAKRIGQMGRNKIASKFSPAHSARFIATLAVSSSIPQGGEDCRV